ncbi:MAG: hypothetical protein DRJ61_12185 [Acidobacteria bacterium]|nr:MAG: hypothetical protein DRJ65_05905 [Acidobacteriota bacterium]RLE30819.1 MAG: hypothetical protein DRJ61_12185 [Acidobacteriota bacterium]
MAVTRSGKTTSLIIIGSPARLMSTSVSLGPLPTKAKVSVATTREAGPLGIEPISSRHSEKAGLGELRITIKTATKNLISEIIIV